MYRKEYNGLIMYYIIIMTTRINKQLLFSGACGKMIYEAPEAPEAKSSLHWGSVTSLMAAIPLLWKGTPVWLNYHYFSIQRKNHMFEELSHVKRLSPRPPPTSGLGLNKKDSHTYEVGTRSTRKISYRTLLVDSILSGIQRKVVV